MAHVTNIIFTGVFDDEDVGKVEDYLDSFTGGKGAIFIDATDEDYFITAGDKVFESSVFVGAFNYLDIDKFKDHIKDINKLDINLRHYEDFQLFIQEEHDFKFQLFNVVDL